MNETKPSEVFQGKKKKEKNPVKLYILTETEREK